MKESFEQVKNFSLNKREFRGAIKDRVAFNVDHPMVYWRGGFIIQHHDELRDLEVEMLKAWYKTMGK